jgi:phosphoribosyl 1,2-cyclic phosphodiesterase
MRFVSLGSGSRGNAALIESGATRILLDNGFALRELERRLQLVQVEAASIDAVLLTHEHQDHVRGIGPLARRYKVPVWMTAGTNHQGRCGELPSLHLIDSHGGSFRIGEIEVEPFPVPHDAREPVQFVFSAGDSRLGMLTDAGNWTPHILELMSSCSALFLECNHDDTMLANGPYPPALQRRVGGPLGHLSNRQAAEFLGKLDHRRLRRLVASHLSEKNNRPELVREALTSVSPGIEGRLAFALQDHVSDWFHI